MSQRMVESVIERLMTDAGLRERFVTDRMETIAELSLRGFELTRKEIDVFLGTDPYVWYLGAVVDDRTQ